MQKKLYPGLFRGNTYEKSVKMNNCVTPSPHTPFIFPQKTIKLFKSNKTANTRQISRPFYFLSYVLFKCMVHKCMANLFRYAVVTILANTYITPKIYYIENKIN